VGEIEFDDGLFGPDSHDLVERLVQRLGPVQGEETRLQQRGLPAAVQPVDDRHPPVEAQFRVLVTLEILQAYPVESHR